MGKKIGKTILAMCVSELIVCPSTALALTVMTVPGERDTVFHAQRSDTPVLSSRWAVETQLKVAVTASHRPQSGLHCHQTCLGKDVVTTDCVTDSVLDLNWKSEIGNFNGDKSEVLNILSSGLPDSSWPVRSQVVSTKQKRQDRLPFSV